MIITNKKGQWYSPSVYDPSVYGRYTMLPNYLGNGYKGAGRFVRCESYDDSYVYNSSQSEWQLVTPSYGSNFKPYIEKHIEPTVHLHESYK